MREVLPSWFKSADPPLDPDSRDGRGFNHDDIGRLLCPVEYDWDNLG